jgi:hypothetical protein
VANAYVTYPPAGGNRTFAVPFQYLRRSHVRLFYGYNVSDGSFASELTSGNGFRWTNDTTVQLTAPIPQGQQLTIVRRTPLNAPLVGWNNGTLRADDLNSSELQSLYLDQEQFDRQEAVNDQATAEQATANEALTIANEALANGGTGGTGGTGYTVVANVAAIPSTPATATVSFASCNTT